MEAIVLVVRRWWRRLAVIVNGSRGLGGWARPFLALPVSWTSWSWEDGRRRGGEAAAWPEGDPSCKLLSAKKNFAFLMVYWNGQFSYCVFKAIVAWHITIDQNDLIPVCMLYLQNSRSIPKVCNSFLGILAAAECIGLATLLLYVLNSSILSVLLERRILESGVLSVCELHVCPHMLLYMHTCQCVRQSVRVWTEGVSRGRVFCARISRCPKWMQMSLAGCPPVPCALTACHLSLSQGERATLSSG